MTRNRTVVAPGTRLRALVGAAVVVLGVGLAACGGSGSPSSSDTASGAGTTTKAGGGPTAKLTASTAPATKPVSSVTWDLPYGEPATLDPVRGTDFTIAGIDSNTCEHLYNFNAKFDEVPALATSSRQISPTEIVYHIRQGVRFWDGHPLTAADVVWSLQRNLDPKAQSHFSDYFASVKSITESGPYTVRVSFKRPDALFPSVLGTVAAAVIEKQWGQQHPTIGTPKTLPMCSGPFKWAGWNQGKSIVLKRNDDYWDKAHAAKAGTFTFAFVTDTSQVLRGLLDGQLQGAYELDTTTLAKLAASTSGTLTVGPSFSYVGIQPAASGGAVHGAMSSPLVRRALALAIDRPSIIKAALGGSMAATPQQVPAPFPVGTYAPSIYQDALDRLGPLNQDLAQAQSLVKQAGAAGKQPIVLAIASLAEYQRIGAIIQANAQAAGLNVKLKALPVTQFIGLLDAPNQRGDVNALLLQGNSTVPDPLDWYKVLATRGIGNYGNYANPAYVHDVVTAAATLDPTKRAQLVVSAQDQLMKDMGAIPLANTLNAVYMDKSITGAPASFSYELYPWAAEVGAP